MSAIIDKWNEVKVLIESLELDVHKNANGNASAGVRARRIGDAICIWSESV